MEIFDKFLTLPVLIFCIIVYLSTLFLRRVIELADPKVKNWSWWNVVILPFGPVGVGMIEALLISSYPFPLTLTVHGWSGRMFQGIICGCFAAGGYKIVKGVITQKLGSSASSILPDKDPLAPDENPIP